MIHATSGVAAGDRLFLHRVRSEAPQWALQRGCCVNRLNGGRAAGHHMRQMKLDLGVSHEQRQRLAAHWFGQSLGTQVCGPDGVGVLDHRLPAGVVPADRQNRPKARIRAMKPSSVP